MSQKVQSSLKNRDNIRKKISEIIEEEVKVESNKSQNNDEPRQVQANPLGIS